MTFDYSLENQNDIHVFHLKGELIDLAQSAPFLYEVERLISKQEARFVLDLNELKYINSSGLNTLIKVLTKSRKEGGDLAVINVNKRITDLLVVTKLSSVFNVCESLEGALKKLS